MRKIIILSALFCTTAQLKAKDIYLVDWPFEDSLKLAAPIEWGKSPLMQHVCKPLVRTNIANAKNEMVLLTEIKKVSNKKWQYQLKSDLSWWDGTKVSTGELKNFINDSFNHLIKNNPNIYSKLPNFKVKQVQETVVIEWQKNPNIGPYFMKNLAFYKNSPKDLQCVSDWVLKSKDPLTIQSKDKKTKIIVSKQKAPIKALALNFSDASQYKSLIKERKMDEPLKCTGRLFQTPFYSAIKWNTDNKSLKLAKTRRLLTKIIPRGEILRAGAGFWGELISAPIPRWHPGYNRTALVHPFDLISAKKNFEYIKSKPEVIKISRLYEEGHYLEKVMRDTFASQKIKLEFVANSKDADGWMGRFKQPWPEMDYGDFSDSSIYDASRLDPKARKALDGYSLSTTFEKPDFTKLRVLHKRLWNQEFMSILMQHFSCMTTQGFKLQKKQRVDIRDPDWLLKLLKV